MWDFDGVIADTEPLQAKSYQLLLKQRGIEVSPDFFQDLIGNSEEKIWKDLKSQHQLKNPIQQLSLTRHEILLPLLEHIEPNWFVAPVLKEIRNLGGISVIVSAGGPKLISRCLAIWGITDQFAAAAALGPGGQRADKEQHILKYITENESVLLIEDSEHYLNLAKQTAALTLGVSHSLNKLNDESADSLIA